jgi:hypothetical protein
MRLNKQAARRSEKIAARANRNFESLREIEVKLMRNAASKSGRKFAKSVVFCIPDLSTVTDVQQSL